MNPMRRQNLSGTSRSCALTQEQAVVTFFSPQVRAGNLRAAVPFFALQRRDSVRFHNTGRRDTIRHPDRGK
jgi:hypothetical protein